MPLSRWSLKRILLLCVGWIVGAPILAAIGIAIAGLVLDTLAKGRQTSISFALSGGPVFATLFGPPVLLVAGWLWARRKGASVSERDRAT